MPATSWNSDRSAYVILSPTRCFGPAVSDAITAFLLWIKGGGRFSLTNRGCLGRIHDAVFRCYWVILAVHRRYTVLGSFTFLQDLSERPGPCKSYMNFNAVLLSRR